MAPTGDSAQRAVELLTGVIGPRPAIPSAIVSGATMRITNATLTILKNDSLSWLDQMGRGTRGSSARRPLPAAGRDCQTHRA